MKNYRIEIPAGAARILKVLEANGYEAYVVGGCVRDSLLGKQPHDWDITTSALPLQVKALFSRTIDTGLKHGTVTIPKGRSPGLFRRHFRSGDPPDSRGGRSQEEI